MTHPVVKALFVLCCGNLMGCGAVVVEGASVAVDKAIVWRNIEAARAGDPVAQYAVGAALCCSGDVPDGTIYSTVEAMEWLCFAAEQGNGDAMLKLGKIFEGDQVDGLRMMRRALTAVTDTPENQAAAYYWYARAVNAGEDNAADAANEARQKMTPAEQEVAARYFESAEQPCGWADLQAKAVR